MQEHTNRCRLMPGAHEIAADIGVWDALDQAVAVRTPFRDPLRAYLDGLTSAASQATAIKRLRAVARLVCRSPITRRCPGASSAPITSPSSGRSSSRPRPRLRRSTSRWPSRAGSRARPATSP